MKIYLLFFVFLSFFSLQIQALSVEDLSHLKVLTPSLSDRKLRKLRLDNQIEVLLVSDPQSPYAAAALSIGIGSTHDPETRAGLAHFVEHMLFLGNQKYPEEQGFSHFLDSHGGKRNAFTMADRTVYMFSIAEEGFKEGLDRFAHFFISPNFTASGLSRECKAIHQEYCKNLPIDEWRMFYVKKGLCNQEHPFHGFSIGNLETLSDVTHDEIKEWYDAHYSSNLMRLCIYSSQSLDELEKLVTPLFEQIQNKSIVRASSAIKLFNEESKKECHFVEPIQDRCSLELSWELPLPIIQDIELHSDKLVSYILGHEGEGSLLSKLKKEGIAHKLCCGKQRIGVDEGLFIISIELTNKGAENYEKVIAHCFDHIKAVAKSGVAPYIYDDVQKSEEINYCYQTRTDLFEYVMENAMYMIDEPIESFPRKTLMPTAYNKEAIDQLLALLTPTKAQYFLLAPPAITGAWPDKKEKWMKVSYSKKTLSDELIKEWEANDCNLSDALPGPNLFLPKVLQLSSATFKSEAQFDTIYEEKSGWGSLYIAQDHCFLTPEVSWQFHYKTPLVKASDAKSQTLMDLFCLAFEEAVNEKLYSAKLAHLDFSIGAKEDGFILKINGFEEKSSLFIATLSKELKKIHLSDAQFATFREMLRKEYEQKLLQSPLEQAGEMVRSIIFENYQTLEQKSEALSELTLIEANTFSQTLFKEGFLEGSCYGSGELAKEKEIWKTLYTELGFSPFVKENHLRQKLASFSKMTRPTYLENRFPLAAGGLMVTLDLGDFTFKQRAVQEILSKAIEEPFFSELRTRQQTAYVVTNWTQEIERHLYNFFAIQSSSHDPRDLLARFEIFLESFVANLKNEHLTEERFAMVKNACIKKILHPQYDFCKMGGLFHTLAFDYEGDFNWLAKRIEGFESLSYEEFLQSVQKIVNRPERVAVLVKGTFEEAEPLAYEWIASIEKIKERLDYKSRN